MDKKIIEIVDWLKNYSEKTSTDGYVLGLSGGIDSALVAALCERAYPGKTLGVIMPCYSDPKDAEDAYLVAESIGLKTIEVNLNKTFAALYKEISEHTTNENKLAKANIKPRLRMTTLYYYSNYYNKLVVGTGNRDERFVGYFTKWGDGVADIMPITHLSKEEVYEYSRKLDLPERIINKAPSAGLWINQTDEQEMGFSYQMIDDYIKGKEVPPEIRKKIERMHKASRHKFFLPPTFEGDK